MTGELAHKEERERVSGILCQCVTSLVRGGGAFYNPSITASDAVVQQTSSTAVYHRKPLKGPRGERVPEALIPISVFPRSTE